MADNISTGILSGLYEKVYNPDVLSCLANLSNDEVFTPPEIVNKMLDMLPQELFSSPDTKFLDPAVKTGVYLREIAKRLIKGLEAVIPDRQQRIDHIFKNQLYGIAITELTSLLSRRSLYCSKYANSAFSVTHFENSDGNIRFKRIPHSFDKSGRCIFCGASETQYDRGEEREYYAYEWIHTLHPEEIFGMKFDVIISNPPYQMKDGGAQASAKPIYQYFVETAKNLKPRFLTMIIPARWYAGGKGLDEFRYKMLNDRHITQIHDYENASDCFAGVEIKGGICYFLWESERTDDCVVTNYKGNEIISTMKRPLLENHSETFIRQNQAVEILHKVKRKNEPSFSTFVHPAMTFGFRTFFNDFEEIQFENSIKIYAKQKQGYISRTKIEKGIEYIDKWKVLIPEAVGTGDSTTDIMKPIIAGPNTISTETYIMNGPWKSEQEAKNVCAYINTKFFHFMIGLKKITQHTTTKVYEFVPAQDFSKLWTDNELYKKYELSPNEINYIEANTQIKKGGDNNG